MKRFLKENTILLAFYLLIFGFLIIVIFSLIKPFNDWSFNSNPSLFGQYGDFIGGFIGTIFSLVAALLLYKTLLAQQESIDKQDDANRIQKRFLDYELFENTFFNLLKTQQELTNGIKGYFFNVNDKLNIDTQTIQGRDFFVYAKEELKKITQSIEGKEYLGKFDGSSDYKDIIAMEIDGLSDSQSDNFCHPDDFDTEKNKIIHKERIRYVNLFYDITKSFWESANQSQTQKRIEKIYSIFFQRYHYAIGHYFRHLYHIIKFVKEFKPTDVKDEKFNGKYIDFIQAQMSSFELMLLYYNAVSFPKLLALLKEFNFLENLTKEDLISIEHNCIDKIELKSRKQLLGKTT